MVENKDFPAFKFWCQKVLPLVYDDSLSYYETLCKVVGHLNELTGGLNSVFDEISDNTNGVNQLKEELNIIQAELDKVKNGEYVSFYLNSIEQWINTNLKTMVGKLAKFVTFGLTNDGYFCAYIPDNFNTVNFDTIIDPSSQLYGHLIMKW